MTELVTSGSVGGMASDGCLYPDSPPFALACHDSLLCPGRPASVPLRHTIASSALATQHSLKWLDGVSDALAYGLRQLRDLRPLRPFGNTPAPTPPGDYPPHCFALPWRAARVPG